MASRRETIQNYYSRRALGLSGDLLKAAASERFQFHGPSIVPAAVVRTDLNGYSTWARENTIPARVALLDDYFTRTILQLQEAGGMYFRDEGDCIVALFTPYFGLVDYAGAAARFCKLVVEGQFGVSRLTAKGNVALGTIAIFQKAHEIGTEDWSAEGEPFVRALRLEEAADSKQQVNWYAEEFDAHVRAKVNWAKPGTRCHWLVDVEKKQVSGVGALGGWVDVTVETYSAAGVVV